MSSKSALVAIAMLVSLGVTASAQPTEKVRRIGFLGAALSSSNPARHEALRKGLREFGWTEGKNLAIEFRFAEGNPGRLRELTKQLVSSKVELIVWPSDSLSPCRLAP